MQSTRSLQRCSDELSLRFVPPDRASGTNLRLVANRLITPVVRSKTAQLGCAVRFLATALLLVGCGAQGFAEDQTSAPPAAEESALVTSGPASLVVPFIDENKKLLSRYNDQAVAKGLDKMPETLEVKNAADAQKYADLRDYFNDKIMEAVHAKTQAMPAWKPDSFTIWSKSSKVPGLCYKGAPDKVIALIGEMASTVFSEQLIIHGWRYKTAKHFGDGDAEYENGFPDVWKEWGGKSNAILVIASQGDDGDDLTPSIIPPCK